MINTIKNYTKLNLDFDSRIVRRQISEMINTIKNYTKLNLDFDSRIVKNEKAYCIFIVEKIRICRLRF